MKNKNKFNIYLTTQQGHLDIVRILLTCGADLNISGHRGITPLHCAAKGYAGYENFISTNKNTLFLEGMLPVQRIY
jgi:hypothetical protein